MLIAHALLTPTRSSHIQAIKNIAAGLLLISCSLTSVSTFATEVYITVDENGNRVFSDQATPQSQKHQLKTLPTIPALPKRAPDVTQPSSKSDTENETHYQSLRITAPTTDTLISREKQGRVTVTASANPAFNIHDQAILLLDGNAIPSRQGLSWQLDNLDRGTHHLQVQILDTQTGAVKISSAPISVNVQRNIAR